MQFAVMMGKKEYLRDAGMRNQIEGYTVIGKDSEWPIFIRIASDDEIRLKANEIEAKRLDTISNP